MTPRGCRAGRVATAGCCEETIYVDRQGPDSACRLYAWEEIMVGGFADVFNGMHVDVFPTEQITLDLEPVCKKYRFCRVCFAYGRKRCVMMLLCSSEVRDITVVLRFMHLDTVS